MTVRFDRIVIAVPDLPAATTEYALLLGARPFQGLSGSSGGAARWGMGNTSIELVQGQVEQACIAGIVLNLPGFGGDGKAVDNALGLDISIAPRRAATAADRRSAAPQVGDFSVDHVVLRTADANADACIGLFNQQLGIRLALDRTVPQWGGRMLFFRAGGLTLEVIAAGTEADSSSSFWGIAYQCPSIDKARQALRARGVDVSEIRDGRKPGTRVLTVKSHCLQIPTLLIEPVR